MNKRGGEKKERIEEIRGRREGNIKVRPGETERGQ